MNVLVQANGNIGVIVITETRELISPNDAAIRIGVTYRRLHQIVTAGTLEGITDSSGRRTFRIEDVEALIRERKGKARK